MRYAFSAKNVDYIKKTIAMSCVVYTVDTRINHGVSCQIMEKSLEPNSIIIIKCSFRMVKVNTL